MKWSTKFSELRVLVETSLVPANNPIYRLSPGMWDRRLAFWFITAVLFCIVRGGRLSYLAAGLAFCVGLPVVVVFSYLICVPLRLASRFGGCVLDYFFG